MNTDSRKRSREQRSRHEIGATRRTEVGMLCMSRKAVVCPDEPRGYVYTLVRYTHPERTELLFATWWEAEIFARAKQLLAVHVCGFVPPVEDPVHGASDSLWERLVGGTVPLSHADQSWHKRYLDRLERAARSAGDYDVETLMERLEREHVGTPLDTESDADESETQLSPSAELDFEP